MIARILVGLALLAASAFAQSRGPVELLPYGGRQAFLAGAMFGSQVEPYVAAARQSADMVTVATHFAKVGHFLFVDRQSAI